MKCLKHCTVRMLIGDGEGPPIKGNIVGQYKMQTADCCRPLFSSCKIEEDKNSSIAFLTLKTMVCSQSTVCILYCPVT